MPYTTQAQVEAYLGRTLTADEVVLLSSYQTAAEKYIYSQIHMTFGVVSETTRYYDSGGSQILDIDPCTDISSVKLVDSSEVQVLEYTLNVDFEAMPRNDTVKTWIQRRYGVFPEGVANIAVSAKFSGGATVPDDIAYVATILVGTLYQEGVEGTLESESIEGYSRKFATSSESGVLSTKKNMIESILSNYSANEGPML